MPIAASPKTCATDNQISRFVDWGEVWVYKAVAHLPNPRTDTEFPTHRAPSTSVWEPSSNRSSRNQSVRPFTHSLFAASFGRSSETLRPFSVTNNRNPLDLVNLTPLTELSSGRTETTITPAQRLKNSVAPRGCKQSKRVDVTENFRIVNSTKEVIEMNMPGFTAEHSLYRTDRHFHTGVSDTFRVLNTEVRPQLRCVWDGSDRCGGIPVGGNGGGGLGGVTPLEKIFEAQCRAGCHRRGIKGGAALQKCLAEC